MRKPIMILVLAVVGLAVAIWLVWYAFQPRQDQTDNTNTGDNTSQTQGTSGDSTSNNGASTDAASEGLSQAVAIQNSAFSPATITVKKGTTVTWTNQDSMGHNVVADDASNSGGLPTAADLLSKGESFSHTFDTAGTFDYHCTPHPFMKGTVEVVE